MGAQGGFYARLRAERGDDDALATVVTECVDELIARETDERRPGMLLGKIQSGKTRAFLGIIAEAFDRGFDVAIVLTKGTRTLAQQTVRRIQKDFQLFRSDEELEVYDIMSVPDLSPWEIDEQKLIFVAKKEANNMRRLLKLFQETHQALLGKRVLVVDDEADFASIRFTKNRDSQEIEQGKIADRIDDLRRELTRPAVLQVTATPYSLYLQPDEYEAKPGANFTFEPKRPAFTKLVPIHGGYIGGDHYFGEHPATAPEYFLWHPVEDDELLALRKQDRRSVKKDQVLTQAKVAALRHALVTFVTASAVRRRQQQGARQKPRRYAMIVHVETSRSAHAWQHTIVSDLLEALQEAMQRQNPIVDRLVDEAIADLSRSVAAAGLALPPRATILSEVREFFAKGAVATERVNSDNEVHKLLDENAELKLRTPCNIFIGGQILDRGITVPNLIGFYYGRSPKRMQQDTVLQHARMYGARPRDDLAVTRFYTTAHNYLALKRIHEFDTALRTAFENGAHDRGVAFVLKDSASRVVPCAPSKILASEIVALKPGGSMLPFGFQTISRTALAKTIVKIDGLVPRQGTPKLAPIKQPSDVGVMILDLIETTLSFEAGYEFDWEACRAAIEYFSRIAAPENDRGHCWIAAETGRTLSRIREGGRYSDAPDSQLDRQLAHSVGTNLPVLLLLRQEGREADGWRGHPFWWPVLFAPLKAAPSIFATTAYDSVPEGDSE